MKGKLVHRGIAALVFLISAVQFLSTAQPSVSFWDPGEISAAAYLLLVPHPPGGPLFSIVGRFLFLLPIPGNIGFRINLLSVFSSAFSVLLLYLVAVQLIEGMRNRPAGQAWDHLGTRISAATGALALSFCDTFWFNGAESNYFAGSTLLYSLIVWLMLLWNEKADSPRSSRYLLLAAFLVGLSTGVHLMSVLAIAGVAMVVVLRRSVTDDAACRKSSYIFWIHVVIVVLVAAGMWANQTSAQPPSPEEYRQYDSNFKLVMAAVSALFVALFWKRVFHRSSFYLAVATGGIAMGIAYPGIVKMLPALLREIAGDDSTIGVIALAGILGALGYLAYWLFKKQKPMICTAVLGIMLAILGFTTYTLIIIRANQNPPMNENDPKTFSGLVTYLNREQYGEFPMFKRRWSGESQHQTTYTNYSSDLDFVWRYQIDHMFNRYVEWNFIGRQSTVQDTGVNWGQLFGIPFFVALFGLYYHFRNDWKTASVFLILFILMGYLITFYQNQQESQPRERDYFYCGAYFVVAVWIALGMRGLLDLVAKRLGRTKMMKPAFVGTLLLGFVMIPGRMFQTNYFTHDRSRDWVPWDTAYNLLQSCLPDGILFTNGDNDTFPLWYLQDVEGVRRDIRVVNLSLANTNWYVKQLKNIEPFGAKKVAMNLTDATIDRLQPIQWRPRVLSIPVPKQTYAEFGVTDTAVTNRGAITFTMPSTLQFGDVKAIRVQDIVVREILEQNAWKRPISFAMTCSEDTKIGAGAYMRLEGFAYRLVPMKSTIDPNAEFLNEPLLRRCLFDVDSSYSTTYRPGFKFRGLNDRTVFKDDNQVHYTQNYRYVFARLASYYITVLHDNEQAVKTLDLMLRLIPPDVIEMDFRFLYSVANLYSTAGAEGKYRALADTIEQVSLKQIKVNPTDFDGYYSPYRILLDVYDKRGEYLKAAAILERVDSLSPGNPQIRNEIERYKGLAAPPKGANPPAQQGK
jgi:transmembrane protein TMEM260 (protein O-mannosyltransferase)